MSDVVLMNCGACNGLGYSVDKFGDRNNNCYVCGQTGKIKVFTGEVKRPPVVPLEERGDKYFECYYTEHQQWSRTIKAKTWKEAEAKFSAWLETNPEPDRSEGDDMSCNELRNGYEPDDEEEVL